MATNFNYKLQTGVPVVTPADKIGQWTIYFADPSGILRFFNPLDSGVYVASTFYPVTGAKDIAGIANVTTGHITFTAGVNAVVYGSSGNNLNSAPTVLGEPSFWIDAVGPNGQLLALPAYTRSA